MSSASEPSPFTVYKSGFWGLFGDIDATSVPLLYQAIITTSPTTETLLLLDSSGGDIVLADGLIHSLSEKFGNYLEIRIVGTASSAAVDLLQAGGLRTALPGAEFFTHPIRAADQVEATCASSFAASLRRVRDRQAARFAARTGHGSRRYWRDFFATDRYFGAQEALSLGIVDHVL